jgi:hypothetical protein
LFYNEFIEGYLAGAAILSILHAIIVHRKFHKKCRPKAAFWEMAVGGRISQVWKENLRLRSL